jgi:hypothetical protein
MACVSLGLVLGIVLVCATAPLAAAERAIAIDVPAGAPFDADELRRALAVRIPRDGAPVELDVALATNGVVQVVAGERVREVDVAGLHGEAAARLVALAASDLVLDDFAAMPPADTANGSARRSAITLGALGVVSSWPDALAGVAVDVTLPATNTLLAVEVGGATLVGADLRMTAMTARLAGGVRPHERIELRAGLTLVPIFVADGVGDRTVLVGGHASARARWPLSPSVFAVLAAGADVFATRTEYRVSGMTVLATPRFAPSFAVGIEVAR